jgi:hypothetical protein
MGAALRAELHFDLAGAGVSVQYRTDGDSVKDLKLELDGKRYAFDGDRIVKQGAKVGSLHTVTLDETPGRPWVGFSLLLPFVALHPQVGRERLRTVAIRTTGQRVPDPDPPEDPYVPLVTESYELFELSGTVSLPGAPDLPRTANDQQWSAVRTIDPERSEDLLEVEGILVFSRTGYSVELKAHPEQPRPGDLQLNLTAKGPAEPTTEVPTTVVVRYETPPGRRPYRTVTISPDGPTIPVEPTAVWRRGSAEQDGRQLKVEASVALPRGSYELALRRAVPQGRNRNDLWLQLTVQEPTPPPTKPRQIEVHRVRYEETSDLRYETVTILPNRATLPVTIRDEPPEQVAGDG